MAAESVQCCVTSPPYWGLRDYGHADQIGQEATPDAFVQTMVEVFREVRRVLKNNGTLWLNLGDSYAGAGYSNHSAANGFNGAQRAEGGKMKHSYGTGLKSKDLVGIPWMVALALRADGWYLRQDIIWAKPNPMPESVTDRCTKSHEYIFLLTKSATYFYDHEAIKEQATELNWESRLNRDSDKSAPTGDVNGIRKRSGNKAKSWGVNETPVRTEGAGNVESQRGIPWEGSTRNKRSVWTVTTMPYKEAHFATYPPDLIKPCIKAGTRCGDIVLDPFGGSGTTGQVALELGRKATLIELNPDYAKIINQRTNITPGLALA